VPAVLTHKTIMLMARERLRTIADSLNAKLLRAGPKSDLEHRVMWLADTAYKMMSDGGSLSKRGVLFPEGAVYGTPLGKDVSPYAVMGSMGPDITAFSALFARGQSWVFDTVHKGNPDENREPVVARTTDFAIEFWNQISLQAAANPPRATKGQLDMMRAYVLGHLCHVAGDVISHPFIHDLEWHLGNQSRAKFSHAGGEASIDAAVAQRILLRRSTRQGQEWDKWWPTRDEVPEVFFAAYTDTLDALYHARSDAPSRPPGFGDFEQKFKDRKPPSLTVDFIKDGYHLYRHGILSIGYGWSYGNWFGMLTPMIVPLSLAIGLSGALPHSRDFFTKALSEVGERAWFEIVTLPLAVGTIIPIVYGAWVASLSTKGIEGLTGSGLAFAILNFIAAVAFFATVGVSDQDMAPWVRWVFLFGPLVTIPLVFTIIGAANLGRDAAKMQGGLALGVYGLPFLLWVAFMLIFLIVVAGLGSLASFLADKAAGESNSNAGDILGVIFYVLGMLIFTALLIVLWVVAPKKLRDAKIPELPKPFPADRPHYVRLFDDSTLGHDPALNAPTSKQLFYPSARRPLLKLWWNGAGDRYVRSEQRQLVFATDENGGGRVVVPVPVMPVTVQDLKAYLEDRVAGLKAVIAFPDDGPRETFLPTGAMFSEDVDESKEEAGYPDDVAKLTKLKKAEADASYVLRHADKPYQALRFGQRGPVEVGNPQEEMVPGPGTVTTAGTTVTGHGTIFGFLFDKGDQIVIASQARVVTLISSDTTMEVSAPFDPNVTSEEPYLRLGPSDEFSPGVGTVASSGEDVTGTNTRFLRFFSVGDFMLVGHQLREVVAVTSDTQLKVADKFNSNLDGAVYTRLASRQERLEGYKYVAAAAGANTVGGSSVMDFAADFAALLCMGMAPHLLSQEKRTVPSLAGAHAAAGGAAIDPAVAKVYQVFRNWSLDRRRLNEWRMLVAGGARSEKATRAEYDASMPDPQPPEADWKGDRVVTDGEPTSNAQGWVPVLRQWLARVTTANPAAADATNAAAPGADQLSNLQLSQALAFLLDLKAPTLLQP
jgi:zinc dependent phospholipase C